MSQQVHSQPNITLQINNPQHYYLLEEINNSIKHLGYAPIDIVNLTSSKIYQEVTKILWRFIGDYSSSLQRQKNLQQKNARLQVEYRKCQMNLQNGLYKEQALIKQKEEILERSRYGQKDIKQRYEKILKQKEETFKEQKKFLEHKQSSLKMELKKYEEKVRVLQSKMKKYLDKQKIQYKNNFQIMNNLNIQSSNKKNQEQIQKQYDYQVTKMIIQEKQRIQMQLHFYQEIFQEIHLKIQSIALLADDQLECEVSKNNNLHITNLPRQKSDHYVKQMRNYIEIISKVVNSSRHKDQKMLNLANLPKDVEKLSSQNLKMRQYYENWQHLYRQMKGLAKSSMSLALQRQNLQAIKQIHIELNDVSQDWQINENENDYNDNLITEIKTKRQALKMRELQGQDFITNKIKFIKQETLVSSRVQKQMENLLTNE